MATPMEDTISIFRSELDKLRSDLMDTNTNVVEKKSLREQTRSVVKIYFQNHRPLLLEQCADKHAVEPLDKSMQEILRYCNARTLRKKYLDMLRKSMKQLNEVETVCFTSGLKFSNMSNSEINNEDKAIIETIAKLCPGAATSYKQGLHDLEDRQRDSWRGTVAEFREALRETLDQLAPDKEVKSQQNFKLEKDRKKPTMKQKVAFILKQRKVGSAAIKTSKEHIDLIEEKTGSFFRSVYDYSSASTHGTPTRSEAISIRKHVALILSELLEISQN